MREFLCIICHIEFTICHFFNSEGSFHAHLKKIMLFLQTMKKILYIKGKDPEIRSLIETPNGGMILCHNGCLQLELNGLSFTLKPQTLLLYPAYGKIRYVTTSDDFEGTICVVSHKFILSVLKVLSWSPNVKFISRNPIAYISVKEKERICGLISIITSLSEEKDHSLSYIELEALWQSLTYEVINCYRTNFFKHAKESIHRDAIVIKFQESLNKDISQHRDVKHYAENFNHSLCAFHNINACGKVEYCFIRSSIGTNFQTL